MLRMFCDELEIIVPARARSAGTLMCLGADAVVMTKQATLGPIDPSLTGPLIRKFQVPPRMRGPQSVLNQSGALLKWLSRTSASKAAEIWSKF